MRAFASILAIIVATISNTYGQSNNTTSIYGTWQFVSGTMTNGANVEKWDSSTVAHYKTITPTMFMYTTFRKGVDTLAISTIGSLTYNGKEMTHTARYSTSKRRVGVTSTYSVEVKGNLMYMKGKLREDTLLDEIWMRIH